MPRQFVSDGHVVSIFYAPQVPNELFLTSLKDEETDRTHTSVFTEALTNILPPAQRPPRPGR